MSSVHPERDRANAIRNCRGRPPREDRPELLARLEEYIDTHDIPIIAEFAFRITSAAIKSTSERARAVHRVGKGAERPLTSVCSRDHFSHCTGLWADATVSLSIPARFGGESDFYNPCDTQR